MRNERNAGRKPRIKSDELSLIMQRVNAGEKIVALAKEYNISRQALYNRLKAYNSAIKKDSTIRVEYIVEDECSTIIELDAKKEVVHIVNYARRISDRAFGINNTPDWDDVSQLFEKEYLNAASDNCDVAVRTNFLCQDIQTDEFGLEDILNNEKSHICILGNYEDNTLPRFRFSRKDLLLSRTDTDGYQLKALSRDRRVFVKSQAIISGILMEDWRVEVMASRLCQHLKIPCVKQHACYFLYGDRALKGVYSKNFELDGYCFISFERLLERSGLSSRDEEFVHLKAIDKLKWCAEKLASLGNILYENTLKYMIDLALIDCLVGNVDRHTKNFGLFFNSESGKYEIPLLFDNGMGLFEHDSYRDKYSYFGAAMNSVYVSPYGEDPFDMLELLDSEFDLLDRYPELDSIEKVMISDGLSSFAKEYIGKVVKRWQK